MNGFYSHCTPLSLRVKRSLHRVIAEENGITGNSAPLNAFLRAKRVLAVEKVFTGNGWSFCVEWLEGGKTSSRSRPKVDYREVLSPEDFALFSRLRDKRKELAQRDGVQVYTIMTNEQLAEIVKQNLTSPTELTQIDGIGAARIEKYGSDLLSMVDAPR